ncbi:MAG: hypothetical protein M1826_002457 [Phylliscum demangeonii]|nr:MAG: hypothetical protein M1826_002457 [Phylliscum demangeonii]
MYHPQKIVSLLLASSLAVHHVAGNPSPREPKTMFGYKIEEVPHALRTPMVILQQDLKTLSALGRVGNIIQHSAPHADLQRLLGPSKAMRPEYFMYEAEKKWQLTLVFRGMMEDTDFLECMAPCLNLPLPVLLQMPTASSVLSLFFCGTKCQEKTGQDRGIAFPYISRWFPQWDEGPAWHDLSQDRAPMPIIAEQAQPLFGTAALHRPPTPGHHLALPHWKPLARLSNSLQSWEHAVQKTIPGLERDFVAGEQRVGAL